MKMTDKYAWLLGAAIAVAAPAGADIVSDWNAKACATVAAAKAQYARGEPHDGDCPDGGARSDQVVARRFSRGGGMRRRITRY